MSLTDANIKVVAAVAVLYGALLVTVTERYTSQSFAVAFRTADPMWWGWGFILVGLLALTIHQWWSGGLLIGVLSAWAWCLLWASFVTREAMSPGAWVPWTGLAIIGALALHNRARTLRGRARGVG